MMKNKEKILEVDGPEAFQTQQTSLEGTVLGGRQLSEIQDIGERTVTAGDISTASGTFRGAAAESNISSDYGKPIIRLKLITLISILKLDKLYRMVHIKTYLITMLK